MRSGQNYDPPPPHSSQRWSTDPPPNGLLEQLSLKPTRRCRPLFTFILRVVPFCLNKNYTHSLSRFVPHHCPPLLLHFFPSFSLVFSPSPLSLFLFFLFLPLLPFTSLSSSLLSLFLSHFLSHPFPSTPSLLFSPCLIASVPQFLTSSIPLTHLSPGEPAKPRG